MCGLIDSEVERSHVPVVVPVKPLMGGGEGCSVGSGVDGGGVGSGVDGGNVGSGEGEGVGEGSGVGVGSGEGVGVGVGSGDGVGGCVGGAVGCTVQSSTITPISGNAPIMVTPTGGFALNGTLWEPKGRFANSMLKVKSDAVISSI